jgi:hypothetical protein
MFSLISFHFIFFFFFVLVSVANVLESTPVATSKFEKKKGKFSSDDGSASDSLEKVC